MLDSDGQRLRLAANAPWRGLAWEGSYALLRQGFPNQHLVDAAGGLSSGLREDMAHLPGFGVRAPCRDPDEPPRLRKVTTTW